MNNAQINCRITEAVGVDRDYVDSLDAMHEAEKVLTDNQYIKFSEILCDLVAEQLPITPLTFLGKQTLPSIKVPEGVIRDQSATAAQRAEAFLQTQYLSDDNK